MADDSKLRSQIQALRNQAKARGHDIDLNTSEEELKEKAFTNAITDQSTHTYVFKDLKHTFLFLLLALFLLFIACIKLSSFPQFDTLRHILNISKFSF